MSQNYHNTSVTLADINQQLEEFDQELAKIRLKIHQLIWDLLESQPKGENKQKIKKRNHKTTTSNLAKKKQ